MPPGVRIAATGDATPLEFKLFFRGPVRWRCPLLPRRARAGAPTPTHRAPTNTPPHTHTRTAAHAQQDELAVPGKPNRASPYSGRQFEVLVQLPPTYPHNAPLRVVFKPGTCYHPSVKWEKGHADDGLVCHMLFSDNPKWSPTNSLYTLGSLLMANLAQPNATHATEADVAVELNDKAEEFVRKAAAAAAGLPLWGGGGGA